MAKNKILTIILLAVAFVLVILILFILFTPPQAEYDDYYVSAITDEDDNVPVEPESIPELAPILTPEPELPEKEIEEEVKEVEETEEIVLYPPTPIELTDPRVRWLVEPQWEFSMVGNFREGMAWVAARGDSYNWSEVYGYINNRGEIIIPIKHDLGITGTSAASFPPLFSEGLVVIQPLNIHWPDDTSVRGVFNTVGEMVLPLEPYWFTSGFSGGTARVWDVGDIDISGNIVFEMPPEFDHVGRFHNGMAIAHKDGMAGFIDIQGNTVIPFEFDTVSPFSEGLAAVIVDNKLGFINESGEIVIPLEFDVAFDEYWGDPILRRFSEGLVAVMQGDHWSNQRWGFINTQGEIVVPLIYSWVSDFWQARAVVSCAETWGSGLVDKDGNIIVPVEEGFHVGWISGGFADISNNRGEHGFIDLDGNMVIPMIYRDTRPFTHGLAAVRLGLSWNSPWGFIDTEGNIVVPLEFDEVRSFSERLAWVRQGRWWGIIEIVED